MGDTGSLAIGGIIGVSAILLRKELMLPVLCGIFFVESLSVLIQRFWFKRTRIKYGTGQRIFRMAPLHHHFELCGWSEVKLVAIFTSVSLLGCIAAIFGVMNRFHF